LSLPLYEEQDMNPVWRAVIGGLAFALAMDSRAALVSFDLNQSNALADGPAYLRVSIDDQGLPGRINFHVTVLGPLLDLAERHFGIDEFGFNSEFAISSSKITGLPRTWKYDGAETMDGFGRFDATVEAKNADARVSSLAFSITGIKMDTISSYLERSSGHAREGNFFFAVHVAGLDADFNCLTDAYFAGSTPVSLHPAPLPGAAGLLVAGLGFLRVLGWRARTVAKGTGTV
jgi:hypothetical protein